LKGQFENGLKYEAQALLIAEGGKTEAKDDHINIKGAKSLLILLAADTNYVMDRSKGWMDGDVSERIHNILIKASHKNRDALKGDHLKDYHSLFNRVDLELGKTSDDLLELPLRKRIENYKTNAAQRPRLCLDPDLEELLFQYGRYLLIASSRPGALPANLQGIWNSENKPAWFSDYHSNINL
jgi:alpha-L-fucosidase 2